DRMAAGGPSELSGAMVASGRGRAGLRGAPRVDARVHRRAARVRRPRRAGRGRALAAGTRPRRARRRARALRRDRRARVLPAPLARVHRDATACVLELHGAPPAPAPSADRPIPLDAAVVRVSSGDGAPAHDGRLETHWIEPVSETTQGALEIDLGAPHAVS